MNMGNPNLWYSMGIIGLTTLLGLIYFKGAKQLPVEVAAAPATMVQPMVPPLVGPESESPKPAVEENVSLPASPPPGIKMEKPEPAAKKATSSTRTQRRLLIADISKRVNTTPLSHSLMSGNRKSKKV